MDGQKICPSISNCQCRVTWRRGLDNMPFDPQRWSALSDAESALPRQWGGGGCGPVFQSTEAIQLAEKQDPPLSLLLRQILSPLYIPRLSVPNSSIPSPPLLPPPLSFLPSPFLSVRVIYSQDCSPIPGFTLISRPQRPVLTDGLPRAQVVHTAYHVHTCNHNTRWMQEAAEQILGLGTLLECDSPRTSLLLR